MTSSVRPYRLEATVPAEPIGRVGAVDATGDVWSRRQDGWWPALDQAGYCSTYETQARPFAHPWSWPALIAEHGPLLVFTLPDPASTGDTGALPTAPPTDAERAAADRAIPAAQVAADRAVRPSKPPRAS